MKFSSPVSTRVCIPCGPRGQDFLAPHQSSQVRLRKGSKFLVRYKHFIDGSSTLNKRPYRTRTFFNKLPNLKQSTDFTIRFVVLGISTCISSGFVSHVVGEDASLLTPADPGTPGME
ncbi:hypothetical protein AVEN_115475-1 [Araneus ventricosus]|uniref:Uncharacterized protein n=1 Tax=Araneus ventricosus TaxID=182803 RepID=A0A4Y2RXK7_ARAVE|nr:hypothetical protein AVEN_115475-1 [Araneus ventricosus]